MPTTISESGSACIKKTGKTASPDLITNSDNIGKTD